MSSAPTAQTLREYLERLERALVGMGLPAQRLLAEVEDHLLESIGQSRARGLDEGDAIRHALRQFGPPEQLAAVYAREGPLSWEVSVEKWLRSLAGLFAMMTTLMALMVAVHSVFFNRDAGAIWTATKVAASVGLILAGAVTLQYWRRGAAIGGLTMMLTATYLQVLGTAAVVWTVHLAIVTGDLESWAVMLGLALIVQGGLLSLCAWRLRRSPLAA
ncbi:MAG TPA: permease prefix domain 1-containing protein [Vicinamibacteria bacterium]|nr:permease prefix domain 1-containing protein [Vicinamibacteria bacterium]